MHPGCLIAGCGYVGRRLVRRLQSGRDGTGGGAYRLTRLDGAATDPGPTAIEETVAGLAAPVLDLHQAQDHLAVGGEPFVFYADAATGRGHVLYLRYDGHYGLVAPE